jgi:Zn-dependent protease
MKTSFKLFDFVGAPVELSLWFFILFLWMPVSWVIAIFVSVLIHEMAHAYVADRRGWRVFGIKVDLFTGSAAVDTNIPEKDAIPVVAAGPLSNLILAILCIPFYSFLVNINPVFDGFMENLFVINIFMFIFNILPIYPMDGGRLLKDFLFIKMKGNRRLAKKISGYVSLTFSVALLLYSISIMAFLLILFSALFIYTSLVEVELVKPSN